MPQSLSSIYIYLVFATKDHQPFLRDQNLQLQAHRYLGGISKNKGCQPIGIGGVEDHVHVLAALGRSISVAEWVKELKKSSSIWLKTRGVPDFAWQHGYGVFSVSSQSLGAVRSYIERQEEHHRRFSFREEYKALLLEHGISFDENRLWE